jgi:hypothetical protein
MEKAHTRLNVVILDACRNNPFDGRGLRAAPAGLAVILVPEGTLVSFATQPGSFAFDGDDGDTLLQTSPIAGSSYWPTPQANAISPIVHARVGSALSRSSAFLRAPGRI